MPILNRKTIVTLAGISSIFLAIGVNGVLSANQEQTPPPKVVPQYPVVAVTQTTLVSHSASITAYGEVKSRNQLSLTSQVSGQITYLSPKFLSGKTFKQGELIAQIEPITYQQAVANAKANLADASLTLAQEKLNSEQAAQEWQQSGLANEQASDLVLRKPQLAAALAKYEMSVKELAKAEYDLAQTNITAPFDSLVVSRSVQMGSNIQTGTTIAQLYDINLFEVSLPLSMQQWQLLPTAKNTALSSELSTEINKAIQVTLNDEISHVNWSANVDRFEQHVSEQSRQRALVAVVEKPMNLASPLFPGTFVKATLTGNEIDALWKLPASALIDNDTVWQVNDEGLLTYLPIKLIFAQGNFVYVKPVAALKSAQVVNRPLSSYLVNMKVAPKAEEL